MTRITLGILSYAFLFSSNLLAATDCNGQQILTLDSCMGDEVDTEETTLYNLINAYRAEKGLSAIALSPALSLVANRHVRDLQKNVGKLSHGWSNCAYDGGDSSTYPCMWDAPKRLGTSYPGKGYENAYSSSNTATAVEALATWKQSPPHNDTILNQSIWQDITWQAIGIGMYQGYAVIWFGDEQDKTQQASQMETTQQDRVLELYSAYFNRAADAGGFGFWKKSFVTYYKGSIATTGIEKENEALQKIAADMATSEEYRKLYPDSLSSTSFIEAIYTNLLGRPSDLEGLNFWSGHIDRGTMSKEQAILNMIAGAKANNSEGGLLDQALIKNKNNISKYFAETLRSDDAELARKAFLTITDDVKTIESTKTILNSALKVTTSTGSTSGRPTATKPTATGSTSGKPTATKPTATKPTATGSTSGKPTGSNAISADEQAILDYHNKLRNAVGVKALTWSSGITKVAQAWVNNLAATSCSLKHSNSKYGENLYWGSGSRNLNDAAQTWEKEKINYESNTGTSGHYTQMVWSNSTELGCAAATCSNGATIIACNYNPPGNFAGQKPY